MEKIKAIYTIKDKRNDKVIYVGQTKDFKQRKTNHFHSRRNRPISNYMFDNGIENFDMFIIEKLSDNVDKETMKMKEQEYIEKYNTIENGLNKQRSGNIHKDLKQYMKEYRKSEKYIESMKEYRKSEKYKEYQKSESRQQYLKEYYKSEEYREKKREEKRRKSLKQKEKNI